MFSHHNEIQLGLNYKNTTRNYPYFSNYYFKITHESKKKWQIGK